MFVLGIDPGLSRCGYGVVRQYGSHLAATAGGVVTTDPDTPLPERLTILIGELRSLVKEVRPDAVVVEHVFFQTNARTAMATGQAAGLALVAAAEAGCEVAQYTSNEVKMAVVGFGSATKDQVQRMVAALLDLPEPPSPPDVADALALALCHLTAQPLRRAVEAATARTGLEARIATASEKTLVSSRAVAAAAAGGHAVWASGARATSGERGGLR
ncbi:MAG TPA: crossover junction endodeoxyribonuclease RuvC [Acidimicrobiales bacterium]|nr:crossover junction endodeoxyribonuclease RuvC [Acidimicrobiales bacterium]